MSETLPIIEPVDREAAEAQGLGGLLEEYAELGDGDALFPRILAHVAGYAEAIGGAMSEAHLRGGVDHELKEIVRIQLARTARDPYFSGLRSQQATDGGLTEERIDAGSTGFETDPGFTDAQRWALRYAHLMYRDPERVDHAFYEEGKRYFTEAQIMELGGLIAVHYGMQVFMRTLQTRPETSDGR